MSNSLKVWSRFSVTNSSGAVVNFRIVDVPKDRYEDFLEQYMNFFIKEESTFRAAGVPKSAEAMEEFRHAVLKRRDDGVTHTVICCVDDGEDLIQNIIGASVMMFGMTEEVIQKKGQLQSPKTEALKTFLSLSAGMLSSYDSIKEFNLEKHFIDRGIFVNPVYRGLGIAQELLRVRRLICKERGVAMHGAWMTSFGTQKAAERDGWETVCEIQYDEFGKKHGVIFENGPPSCKFMVARIPLE